MDIEDHMKEKEVFIFILKQEEVNLDRNSLKLSMITVINSKIKVMMTMSTLRVMHTAFKIENKSKITTIQILVVRKIILVRLHLQLQLHKEIMKVIIQIENVFSFVIALIQQNYSNKSKEALEIRSLPHHHKRPTLNKYNNK